MAARRSARRTRSSSESTPARSAASSPSRGRRAGSRRSRGGGAEDGGSSGPHRPAIGRDGKASISCPNCAARYKIAEDMLEGKVTCTQCHRTFFPLAAAGSRRKPADNSKPVIYGVVALLAIILIGVIINSMSAPPPPRQGPKVEAPRVIALGKATREVRSVMAWAAAIGEKDGLNAQMHTDFDAVQKMLGISPEARHSTTFGDDQSKLADQILETLYVSDQALVYRAYRPTMGRIMAESMVAAKAGTIRLSLYPRNTEHLRESATVEVSYRLDPKDDNFKVYAWKVTEMARVDYLLELIDGKNPKKTHQDHELIGEVTSRKIMFGGKEVDITEAELVPLPHHKDTPEADRKRIDLLIGKVIDLDISGILRNRANEELINFGKAAVPRLLSKIYELHKMKSQEDVLTVNLMCRALRLTTGWRFGFNPRDHKGSDLGGTDAERVSSLKQWYAWWARNYDREDWKLEDSDEEIEMTTEQIEAKRAAAREAKKIEVKKRRARARGGK